MQDQRAPAQPRRETGRDRDVPAGGQDHVRLELRHDRWSAESVVTRAPYWLPDG